MPRFRLLDPDGNDLGPFVSSEPNWRPGHVITRGPGDQLVVVNVVDAGDLDDFQAYLVVKSA